MIAVLASLTVTVMTQAQNGLDSVLISQARLNFAVPDLPAFKAVGNNPGTILRPSTPEALSVVASSFIGPSGIMLPKTLAAEFNPALAVFADKITLSEYRKRSQLYSIRLSLGTSADSAGIISSAIGIRSTLIDDGDMKNDQKQTDSLYAVLSREVQKRAELTDEYLKLRGITEEQFAENTEIQAAVDRYLKDRCKSDVDTIISKMKTVYKEEHWNARKLDIALAAVAQSTDSTGGNTHFRAADAWITLALPVGKVGQWLIGGNARVNNDVENDSVSFCAALSTRLYLGSNRYKGFFEAQYKYDGADAANFIFGNGGAELNIHQCVWLDLSLGLNYDFESKDKSVIPGFSFRYALPENFKFF